jgi:hypothetical protein
VREAHPNYMGGMCGRVIQSSGPFNLAIVHGMNVHDTFDRWQLGDRETALVRYDSLKSAEALLTTGQRTLDR